MNDANRLWNSQLIVSGCEFLTGSFLFSEKKGEVILEPLTLARLVFPFSSKVHSTFPFIASFKNCLSAHTLRLGPRVHFAQLNVVGTNEPTAQAAGVDSDREGQRLAPAAHGEVLIREPDQAAVFRVPRPDREPPLLIQCEFGGCPHGQPEVASPEVATNDAELPRPP